MQEGRPNFAECRCGQVRLKTTNARIVSTVCHCSHCQQAGRMLQTLPDANPILDEQGGTPLVLCRKDLVHCIRGETLMSEHRLKPDSPTRRAVATCCNTAMFLDFTKGHWVSIYRIRFPMDGATAGRNSKTFMPQLIWAWVKMGFRTPKIDYVKGGTLDLAS